MIFIRAGIIRFFFVPELVHEYPRAVYLPALHRIGYINLNSPIHI
jgi:hypothetical protein